MYKVIHRFIDLQDNNHEYNVGDLFPHNGVDVCNDRIEELSTTKNRLGIALIAEIIVKQKSTRKKKTEE